jgi:hypothetical protein
MGDGQDLVCHPINYRETIPGCNSFNFRVYNNIDRETGKIVETASWQCGSQKAGKPSHEISPSVRLSRNNLPYHR